MSIIIFNLDLIKYIVENASKKYESFNMVITTLNENGIIKIKISGSANSADMKEFVEVVDSVCNENDKNVDVDLSEMEYMDSTCISLLLKINKFQKQKNREFVISKASYTVSSLLSLCSLADTLK